jgi:23S rRNA (pseudouridine1915-N3)-methyltransferase
MKLVLLSVGRMRSAELRKICSEYLKRMKKYASVECKEVKEEKGSVPSSRAKEASRILDFVRPDDFLIVCDQRGQQFSSKELSAFLQERERSGRGRTVFLIGGPYGFDKSVKDRADLLMSMSRLTFPHELAQTLLVETLYRSFSITRGEKYHHG